MALQRPVATTSGGEVRGVRADGGVAAFRNLPYAAAPVGPLRFRAPVPPEPWPGVREAADFGPTAPKAQYAPPFDVLLPETDIPGDDCLNLNVWTPDPDGSAPVLVWIHGGAFANGSGSARSYDGAAFARDGVVLVTLNYRLGVEGFLYFGRDDVPANLGLLDQIAALRWVRENIAAFGGDPGKVTVFGESAGAMSIGTLLAMPQAAGLFQRAILQSGAAHHTLDPDAALRVTHHLAGLLELEHADPASFAAVPRERLLAAQRQLRTDISLDPSPARWGRTSVNLMPFEPVVDGTVLARDPALVAADGQHTDVDILIGSNTDEFRLFTVPTGLIDIIDARAVHATAGAYGLDDAAVTAYQALYPQDRPGEIHARLVTDWFYRIPALRLAEANTRRRPGSAFVYEFAWQPPTFGGRLGACHASELPFVFDALDDAGLARLLGTAPPQRLADAMHAAWVAFATTGDPGWPTYDVQRRTTMRFDDPACTMENDPRAAERELWERVRG